MTEKLEVEFDDRYGGRKPPWNYCRGQCKAMGVVPVRLPDIRVGLDPSADPLDEGVLGAVWAVAIVGADDRLLDLARAAHERGEGHEDGHCDGWHFVQCPDCGGTGEISKLRALRYLPGKFLRTLRFVWYCGRARLTRARRGCLGASRW